MTREEMRVMLGEIFKVHEPQILIRLMKIVDKLPDEEMEEVLLHHVTRRLTS